MGNTWGARRPEEELEIDAESANAARDAGRDDERAAGLTAGGTAGYDGSGAISVINVDVENKLGNDGNAAAAA